jgi:hypothetical protein
MQYRLRTLLIALTLIGIACAALAAPTALSSGLVFAAMVLFALTSVLVLIYERGAARAFAVGFLVFSVGYIASSLIFGDHFPPEPGSELPASRAVLWVYAQTHGKYTKQIMVTGGGTGGGMGGMSGGFGGGTPRLATVPVFSLTHFNQATHCIAAIGLGIVGGIVAQLLERRSHRNAIP